MLSSNKGEVGLGIVPSIATVSRLYQIVYGRPADRGGLDAYVGHLRAGLPVRAMVEALVASDEFLQKVGDGDPARLIGRHALGPGAPTPQSSADLVDLVLALLESPAVVARLPVRPALFPDGAPLDDPAAYRLWLAAAPVGRGGDGVAVSFVVPVEGDEVADLAECVRAALSDPLAGHEVVVVARWPGTALRGAILGAIEGHAGARLVRAPFAWGRAGLFNAGLRRARGVFTGLVGADERVDAGLGAVVAGVVASADLVLSDSDRLDAAGLRRDPVLEGGWDPDRVMAQGATGVLLARTAVLRALGGMRAAGERDLVLRVGRRLAGAGGASRVVHVPAVLVSRRGAARVWAGGARQPGAADVAASGALLAGGARAVLDAGTIRVVHPLPKKRPRASIVIATRDRASLLAACADGLLNRTAYDPLEVVIVDNGSTEADAVALLARLAGDARVRVLAAPGPFNWAALNNLGVQAMSGAVAVLLNNDIEVMEPDWLRELVSQAMRPEVGAVGAKLLYPDGRVQHAGVILAPDDHALHRWRFWPGESRGYGDSLVVTREVMAVTGACLAIRRDVYAAVGGCEAEHLPVTWNDVDLCLKVRARGLRVIWTPHARLLHREQASRGSDDLPENQARFRREQAWMQARWGDALRADPFRIANLYPDEAGRRLSAT